MTLESPNTLLGQLQRGQGRGYVTARNAKDVDALLHCIHHDPRWDRQLDGHPAYYARLALDLALPVSPITEVFERADGDDAHNLPACVLAELGRRGQEDALNALRAALRSTRWRLGVIGLQRAQLDVERPLVDKADLTALMAHDGWRDAVIEWRPWTEVDSRIRPEERKDARRTASVPKADTAMTTEELLAIARRANRERIKNILVRRRDTESVAAMRAAAQSDVPDRCMVALRALGEHGDSSLLEYCERRLAVVPPGLERAGLVFYLLGVGPEHSLPLARRLLHVEGSPASAALRVFARYAEPQDRALLEPQLEALFEKGDLYGVGDIAKSLGVIGDARSADALVAMFEAAPFPFIRHDLLIAIYRCSLHHATALTPAALYDCDDSTRCWATTMASRSESVEARIRALAADVFEWEEIRQIASRRVADFEGEFEGADG